MIAKDAGIGIGSYVDGANVFDAGGIARHEFFPEGALRGLEIETIDAGGKFAWLSRVCATVSLTVGQEEPEESV